MSVSRFTFSEERPGDASWSTELVHVRAVDGIIEAELFDLARETWYDVRVGEIDDICDGRTGSSDPTLVAMVQAADTYIIEQEAA